MIRLAVLFSVFFSLASCQKQEVQENTRLSGAIDSGNPYIRFWKDYNYDRNSSYCTINLRNHPGQPAPEFEAVLKYGKCKNDWFKSFQFFGPIPRGTTVLLYGDKGYKPGQGVIVVQATKDIPKGSAMKVSDLEYDRSATESDNNYRHKWFVGSESKLYKGKVSSVRIQSCRKPVTTWKGIDEWVGSACQERKNYQIEMASAAGKCVTIAKNEHHNNNDVIIQGCTDSKGQVFAGFGKNIIHIDSNKCLNVPRDDAKPGQPIKLHDCNNDPGQQFAYVISDKANSLHHEGSKLQLSYRKNAAGDRLILKNNYSDNRHKVKWIEK